MNGRNYPRICDNCKWFDKYPEEDPEATSSKIPVIHLAMFNDGNCRRYPTSYPKKKTAWCGEFAIMRDPRVENVGTEGETT